MTYAAKGYFDALVKMGELASESQGSKELGKSPDLAETPGPLTSDGRVWVCLVSGPNLMGDRFSPSNEKSFP